MQPIDGGSDTDSFHVCFAAVIRHAISHICIAVGRDAARKIGRSVSMEVNLFYHALKKRKNYLSFYIQSSSIFKGEPDESLPFPRPIRFSLC